MLLQFNPVTFSIVRFGNVLTLSKLTVVLKITSDQHLTINEAAIILNVSPNTLRNWDKSGKLKAIRHPLNNYRLYRKSKILKMLNSDESSGKFFDESLQNYHKKSLLSIVQYLNRLYWNHGFPLIDRFLEIIKLIFTKITDEVEIRNKLSEKSKFRIKHGERREQTYRKIKELYERYLLENNLQTQPLLSSKTVIYKAVKYLQDFELLSYEQDIKGLIFEELVKNTFEKDENQQYFTPRVLVDFLVNIIDLDISQKFCDPACGTGGFLIKALEKIRSDLKYSDIENIDRKIYDYSLTSLIGIEVDKNLAWISQMNVFLHSGAPASVYYLPNGGSLAYSNNTILKPKSFDIIITNPPFGSDYSEYSDLAKYYVGRGKKSVRRGILFIERCLNILKPNGRLGIIIDDSILNGLSNKDIRKLIFKQSIIIGVISLPEEMFCPYATVKASILILEKKGRKKDQPLVFMAEAKYVGKKPNGQPLYSEFRDDEGNLILLNDLPLIAREWKKRFSLGETPNKNSGCFLVNITKRPQDNSDLRLDVTYHDPRKELAKTLLKNSNYPIMPLSAVVDTLYDTIIPSKEIPNEYFNYIGLANIEKKTGNYETQEILGQKLRSAAKKFLPNSIVFSTLRPKLRKIAYIEKEEGYCSSECLVFIPIGSKTSMKSKDFGLFLKDSPKINLAFLAIVLRSDLVYGQIIHQITGIGRPRISRKAILNIKIPIPPIEVQNNLIRYFEENSRKCNRLKEQSKKLLEQSDLLMREGYSFIQEKLCESSWS